jgi:signal transduction histidine kinase
LDPDWIDAGSRRSIFYSYLPPGAYTFRVIAANADGVWNNEGKSIRVIVLAPFYRTWWFAALSVVLLTAIVLLVFRTRVNRLKARAAEQEGFARQLIDSQELERTRIAAELHDGLSQSMVIIKNRAMLSVIKSDDHDRAIEQLKEIAEASTSVIDEVKDIVYDLRPIQLDRLGLTKSLEDIVDKVSSAHEFSVAGNFDDIDGVFLGTDFPGACTSISGAGYPNHVHDPGSG